MGRGTKLDLNIGAQFESGWRQVDDAPEAAPAEMLEPAKHRLKFKKEKRRGKTVTLAGPFAMEAEAVQELLGRLKKRLGCGGTFKEGWMEFQGDIESRLRPFLADEGFGGASPR